MEPAVVLGGSVALSLLVLGAAMRRTAATSGSQAPPFRRAVPWIVGSVIGVGSMLLAIPAVPQIVIVGLASYTAVAVTALWRMTSLDRNARWMLPSRRLARFGFAAFGLTWLGFVLGLLLRIADMLAAAPRGL